MAGDAMTEEHQTGCRNTNLLLVDAKSLIINWGCDLRIETKSLDHINDTGTALLLQRRFETFCNLLEEFQGLETFLDLQRPSELLENMSNLRTFVNPIRMSQAVSTGEGPLDGMLEEISKISNNHRLSVPSQPPFEPTPLQLALKRPDLTQRSSSHTVRWTLPDFSSVSSIPTRRSLYSNKRADVPATQTGGMFTPPKGSLFSGVFPAYQLPWDTLRAWLERQSPGYTFEERVSPSILLRLCNVPRQSLTLQSHNRSLRTSMSSIYQSH